MLRVVLLIVVAVVALVACVVAFVFALQGLQALRFRASMRKFATDDAQDQDPALDIPEQKGTIAEEAARQEAIWALFYRDGLSIAKLNASRRLREAHVFTLPEWIFWIEWRGWQKLATQGSKSVRKRASSHAKAEADRQLDSLSPRNLSAWLELYDDNEHPALKLRWAQHQLPSGASRAALQVLEELSSRDDVTGAAALHDLFEYHRVHGKQSLALRYAKKALGHREPSFHEAVRRGMRYLFTPSIDRIEDCGKHWRVSASRNARVTVRVHALEVKADPKVWLDSPLIPLQQAERTELLWDSPIDEPSWSLRGQPWRTFKIPHLDGPLHIEATAQFPIQSEWTECMGDESMPIATTTHRLSNTSLDAVLTVTETSVSTWVVDKKTKSPVPNVSIKLMHRDVQGSNLETYVGATNDDGIFSWRGYGAWQFGVLVERKNSQGRMEHLFLTHGHDVVTSKAPSPQRRFYVMLARPLYRPGERVQGKLFVRVKGHEGNSKRTGTDQTFQLEVIGPQGNKLTNLSCAVNVFGTAAFDFTIPTDATLGRYSFRVANDGRASIEGSLYVEEFVAPEFRAELRAQDTAVWGRKCVLEFDAQYFFGGPVANAQGTLEVRRSNWKYRNPNESSFTKWFGLTKQLRPIRFKTDARGKATIEVGWRGPWDPFRRFDGTDFDFLANVRDASGKSCQANLHLSVPRVGVIVNAKPVRKLRLPGETLPISLQWQSANASDTKPRTLVVDCRQGWTRKTITREVRPVDEEIALPIELPAGRWEMSAYLEGQPRRARTKHSFTLLGPDLQQKRRELIVSNDPTDMQGTIRVAVTGPRNYCAKELLVYNRGSRLGSQIIPRSSSTAWVDLPFIGGTETEVYLSLWYLDARDEPLHRIQATARINPLEMQDKAPNQLSLSFPAESLRPGTETILEAKLSSAEQKPSEMAITVMDEALLSLVPPPPSARAFFERSPPRPQSFPAWSNASIDAQIGRRVALEAPSAEFLSQAGSGAEFMRYRMQSMPMPSMASMAGPVPMPAARKSASPLSAAAAVVAAPVALAGAGVQLIADAARKHEESGKLAELADEPAPAAPVQLRSDFSAEAAWHANAMISKTGAITLPVKLPDTLTRWKAKALLVSLAHDHLLEAETHVRTEKPIMIRLQAPRFLQQRDKLTLRAMLDARSSQTLSVRATLEAAGIELPESARQEQSIAPHGQARMDVEFTVPACEFTEIVLRATAIATNVDDASDAEERRVSFRPYGVLLRKTMSGVLTDEPATASFELPEERGKEFTKLSVQIDRGPMDAILTALDYLREYPYGCVEQTCSRLLPYLLFERLDTDKNADSSIYRHFRGKFSDDVVAETLQRITSMQSADGGHGWWPGGVADMWMTAYVVFTFAMAAQPDSASARRAREYLKAHLLKRDHSDDADVFAAFALEWSAESVSDRVIEVLESRWEALTLTEKAKFCWVLAQHGHKRAAECADELRSTFVVPAKRFLKKVARDDETELQWLHPGSTEAIAFFVLGALEQRKRVPGSKLVLADDATLELLVAFLLHHRKGARWHSTRDTAIAVFALLAYEDAMRSQTQERQVDVQINGSTKRSARLERLGHAPVTMQFADDDLQAGANELAFVLADVPNSKLVHRHFTAELEYFTQEDDLAAQGEGIAVERTYWLLDEKKEPTRKLRNGDKVRLGQRIRVTLEVDADKPRTYLLLEDRKFAGCEPVAKKSGRDVCSGQCAHVELRADRTAIFFDSLGTDRHRVSYDIEAILPGRFAAMPARIETMYETRCFATSSSFVLSIEDTDSIAFHSQEANT